MRADIFGIVPMVGDTVVRALYSRNAGLHIGKVTGETKSNHPKIDKYRRDSDGVFEKNSYSSTGHIPGDFIVIKHITL